jgi:hypothetical protein
LYAGLYALRRPVHLCAAGRRHHADAHQDADAHHHADAHSQPCFTITYVDCHRRRALAHADAYIIRRADDAAAHDRPERNAAFRHAKRDPHAAAADAHADDRRHTLAHHQAVCQCDRYNAAADRDAGPVPHIAAADRYTGPIPHIAVADAVTFDTPG